jgi:hypothetical protein
MHSGGLAHDEVPIIAQEGEYMLQRDVVRQPGMLEFLHALNSGALFHTGGIIPRYHSGGEMGTWKDYINAILNDSNAPGWATPNLPDNMPWSPPDDLDQSPTGPQVIVPRDDSGDRSNDRFDFGDSPQSDNWLNSLTNFGFAPPIGTPGWLQGPTMIPSMFDPQGYPIAQPVWNNPTDPVGLFHGSQDHINPNKHSGGPIGRMHSGGSIGRFSMPRISRMHVGGLARSIPRMHSGGLSLASGSGSRSSGSKASAINIAAFIDHQVMGKWLGGQKGRKIMFDAMRGRHIDLGF